MYKKILSSSLIAIPSFALATVSIQFSNPGTLNFADGFQNSSGVSQTGMYWGIVVDTGGLGFDGVLSIAYDPFDVTSSGFLSVGGLQSDDYFVLGSGDSTGEAPPFLTLDASSFGGGVSAILDMNGIDVLSQSLSGLNYGILWFESNSANFGENYGFMNSTLVMPNDGEAVDHSGTFATLFPGPADLTIGVPEPSHYALFFGVLGLGFVLWRRRK